MPGTFADIALEEGFDPDPRKVEVAAGGDLAASTKGGASCSGYIADVPDITLTYKAGMLFDLYVFVRASTDTTLVIRTPSGRWLCDDDSAGGEDPLITMSAPILKAATATP